MAHGWYIPQIMQEPLPKHPLNIITLPFFSWRDLHPDPRCKYAVCWIIHKWYGSFRSVVLILFQNLIKADKTLHAMCIMYLMRFDCLILMRESLKSSSRQYKKNVSIFLILMDLLGVYEPQVKNPCLRWKPIFIVSESPLPAFIFKNQKFVTRQPNIFGKGLQVE